MQVRKLLTDDDAVSPVIGVILMVAITVILAAVIGAFVLGFGGGGPSAPSVTWDSDDGSMGGGSNYYVTFAHEGGDNIENSGEVLSIQGTDASTGTPPSPGTMQTGDEYNLTDMTSSPTGEYTLVWSPEDGDSSQELATHNA